MDKHNGLGVRVVTQDTYIETVYYSIGTERKENIRKQSSNNLQLSLTAIISHHKNQFTVQQNHNLHLHQPHETTCCPLSPPASPPQLFRALAGTSQLPRPSETLLQVTPLQLPL